MMTQTCRGCGQPLAAGVGFCPNCGVRSEGNGSAYQTPTQPMTRHVRMILRTNPGSTPPTPLYGIALDEIGVEPPQDSGQHAGPALVLNRGEPVSVTVINRTPEPTSVHWHGIELESYFDGVPGISGIKPQVAPLIAPSDSFEVRFTPPRLGTFIYHSHVNEKRQHRAGLVGQE